MQGNITQRQADKNKELDEKLAELAGLEVELAEHELELATLRAELCTFESEYLRVIGSRYITLDAIEAEIVSYLVLLNPENIEIYQQAEEAWNKAQKTKHAVNEENIDDSKLSIDFKPWNSLKKLYREIAKCIHPDLAINENERHHRQKLMTETNIAYENGDEERLQTIFKEWKNYPDFYQGDETANKMVCITQKITQVRERLRRIHEEIKNLRQSDLYHLKAKAIVFKQEERSLILEIATKLDEQIITAKRRLKKIKTKINF